MKHGIEHIQIRIPFLKRLHIFDQQLFCDLSVRRAARCGFAVTELHDRFIKCFLSFSGGNVFVIIIDAPAGLLLSGIVRCK